MSRVPRCFSAYRCSQRKRISPADNNNNNDGSKSLPTHELASCDKQETTCFNDDRVVETTTLPLVMPTPGPLDFCVSDDKNHDIKDFLSRPILIDSPSWTTAQIAGTVINAYNFPSSLLSNNMYLYKIQNFFAFRATMVFRIVMNAERFQQGRLVINWFPQATINTVKYAQAVSNLVYATQLLRVDFDASTDTDVILECPYISPMTHYNVPDQSSPFGTLTIMVYDPLISPTGSTSLPVQVWAYCKDISLEYPARPQSSVAGKRRGRNLVFKRSGGKAIGDSELATMGNPPVSESLSLISRTFSLFKNIPIVGGVANSVSWASNLASNLASSFGYSKPGVSGVIGKITPKSMANMININAPDNSTNLGMFADNEIGEYSGFGATKLDEMSISYIIGIPTFYDALAWDISQAADLNLHLTPVSPASFYKANSYLTVAYKDPLPLYSVGRLFKYWRGSITYTMKVVKTEFHSGRLMFVFDPGHLGGAISSTASSGLYREIFDLRTSNEFSVTVPYVSTKPYLKFAESTGNVLINVETPLRAPSTVSASVHVLMEVSAGPDFEFAVPIPPSIVPVFPGQSLAPQGLMGVSEVAEPQALGENLVSGSGDSQLSREQPISKIQDMSMNASVLCVGERITSALQLIKRFLPIYSLDITEADAYQYTFSPNTVRANLMAAPALASNLVPIDYIDYFGVMFGYRRGSIRVKFSPDTYLTTGSRLGAALIDLNVVVPYPKKANAAAYATLEPMQATVIEAAENAQTLEVTLPFYSPVPFITNFPLQIGSLYPLTDYTPSAGIIVSSLSVIQNPRFYRAAGEDFSFGYFLCTTPLCETYYYANNMPVLTP